MSICEQKESEIFTRSHRNNDSDDTSGKNITLSENVSGSDIKIMAALSTVTLLLRGKGARAQLKRARQGSRGEREGKRGLESPVNINNT